MRALTIKRQYAELIATGVKQYEVRKDKTPYRGPVIITISKEKITYCLVDLIDIVPSASISSLTPEELAYGKWAYRLYNPRLIETVPCKGKLGLWTWNAPIPNAIQQHWTQLSLNL